MLCIDAPALFGQTPESSLAMVSEGQRVMTSATVMKIEGAGLKALDEEGVVVGSMAQLPTEVRPR